MTTLAKVPVTVVTGFLGSGKTTLIQHLIANANGKKLAVLVNEFGAISQRAARLGRDPPGAWRMRRLYGPGYSSDRCRWRAP